MSKEDSLQLMIYILVLEKEIARLELQLELKELDIETLQRDLKNARLIIDEYREKVSK